MRDFSPELIIHWMQMALTKKQLAAVRQAVEDFETNPEREETKLTEEQVA